MNWKYDKEKITYFADTDFRGQRVRFGIRAEDRARHMYIIGKTGMGKSTLLENLAVQDIMSGEGMCFIDPHGGTAELLLKYVPKERINDVIYFAPFDMEYPVAMNVLEKADLSKRPLIASGLLGAFKKVWPDSFSARMEYMLSNSLLALLETPGSTLLGVNRMLADKGYRDSVIANVTDTAVKAFWIDEFGKWTDKMVAEAVPAIQNKVGQFSANPLIRNILGQAESTFDIRWIMDNRKIFIVNLSKGRIGESNASLLGAMLITKMYLAAMSRAEASPEELKELPPFYLYVDEFQSFANESFADILSEARKYKLCLTVAHQYIEQMTDEVRAAVFGNVGTMITFRVGSTDAEALEKEFAPVFTVDDFVSLGFAQVYLKLMIKGAASAPFSARTRDKPPLPDFTYENEALEASRKQFARPRLEVEASISEWFKASSTPEAGSDNGAPQTKRFAPGARPDRPRYEGNNSSGGAPRFGGGDRQGGGDRYAGGGRPPERPSIPGGMGLRDALVRVGGSAGGASAGAQQQPYQPRQQEFQPQQSYGQEQQMQPQQPPQYPQQPAYPQYAQPQMYPYGQYPQQPPVHYGYPYALPPAMPQYGYPHMAQYPVQPYMQQPPYPAAPPYGYQPTHPGYVQYAQPPQQAPAPVQVAPAYSAQPQRQQRPYEQQAPNVPREERPRREESRPPQAANALQQRRDGEQSGRSPQRDERPRNVEARAGQPVPPGAQKPILPRRDDHKGPTPERVDALAAALAKLQQKSGTDMTEDHSDNAPEAQQISNAPREDEKATPPAEVPLDVLKSVLGDNE